MAWQDFHRLLVHCEGDLLKAKPEELYAAIRANPEAPTHTFIIARRIYERQRESLKKPN